MINAKINEIKIKMKKETKRLIEKVNINNQEEYEILFNSLIAK